MKCIFCSQEAMTDLIVCFNCLLKDTKKAFKYVLARKIYERLSTDEYKTISQVAKELSANVHTVRDSFKLLQIFNLVEVRWKLERGIWTSIWI